MSLEKLKLHIDVYKGSFPRNTMQHAIFDDAEQLLKELYNKVSKLYDSFYEDSCQKESKSEPLEKAIENQAFPKDGWIPLADFKEKHGFCGQSSTNRFLTRHFKKPSWTGQYAVKARGKWFVDPFPLIRAMAKDKEGHKEICWAAAAYLRTYYPEESF